MGCSRRTRGLAPVVGLGLLVFLTVLASLTLLAAVPSLSAEPVPTARLTVTADATTETIALTHEGGDRLDVTELDVTVWVDGRPLAHQPPVPFFAAVGFRGGPTGPFNTASESTWVAGETAGVRLATTNDPPLDPGAEVIVRVATDGGTIYRGGTTAG